MIKSCFPREKLYVVEELDPSEEQVRALGLGGREIGFPLSGS
jgi:hypothetical protein